MSQYILNIGSTFLNEVKTNYGLTVVGGLIVLLMGLFAIGPPFVAGILLAVAVGYLLIVGALANWYLR